MTVSRGASSLQAQACAVTNRRSRRQAVHIQLQVGQVTEVLGECDDGHVEPGSITQHFRPDGANGVLHGHTVDGVHQVQRGSQVRSRHIVAQRNRRELAEHELERARRRRALQQLHFHDVVDRLGVVTTRAVACETNTAVRSTVTQPNGGNSSQSNTHGGNSRSHASPHRNGSRRFCCSPM